MDYESPVVQDFIAQHSRDSEPPEQRAIDLYYAVRDLIRYDPYTPDEQLSDFAASCTLQRMRVVMARRELSIDQGK